MSHSTAKGKVIGRFTIGFDDETKAAMADLKTKLEALPKGLMTSNMMPIGGLLAAMQDTAANDAPQPELKHLGQWVFEGQDEKWQSAAVDGDGRAFLYQKKKSALIIGQAKRYFLDAYCNFNQIDGVFDASDWKNSAIDRETFNDVDYLSESVPEIQGMDVREIIIDELWPDKPAPQITQADMQLVFIKNLSEVLIQRMHTMSRFSGNNHHIGGDKLMAWDIVFNNLGNEFGVVTGFNKYHQTMATFFKQLPDGHIITGSFNFHTTTILGKNLRTIPEAELPAFRAALEACYA